MNRLVAGGLGLLLLGLTGCGGGGGSSTGSEGSLPGSTTAASQPASLSLAIHVPDASVNRTSSALTTTQVPTVSIQVLTVPGNAVVASATVPLSNGGPTTQAFQNLPLGPVAVQVQAANAQGAVVSTGATQATIQAGSNQAAVDLTLKSQFLYVTNTVAQTVTGFQLNPLTETLTQVGTPLPVRGAETLTPDTSGQFLYVVDALDSQLNVFSVNQTSGALTALPQLTVGLPNFSIFPVITPDNRFLYMSGVAGPSAVLDNLFPGFGDGDISGTAQEGAVFGFARNPVTGALSPVPGSPDFLVGNGASDSPLIDPTGHFLYSATTGLQGGVVDQLCNVFAIQSNGSLTQLSGAEASLPELLSPTPTTLDTASAEWISPVINPVTGVAYFQSFSSLFPTVPATFQAVPLLSNGSLGTPLSGSPVVGTGSDNFSVIDPSGQFLYGCDLTTNAVDLYVLDPTTGLPHFSQSFPTDASPGVMTFDPSGQFAVVACRGASPTFVGSVDLFNIDSKTGVLTKVASVSSGARTDQAVFVPLGPAPAPTPAPTAPPVLAAGSLTYEGAAPGGGAVLITPDDRFAYISDFPVDGEAIQGFTVNADGTLNLNPVASISDPNEIIGMVMDPQGQFLFTVDTLNVRTFAIQSNGSLSEISGSPLAVPGAGLLAIDRTGTFLYATANVAPSGGGGFHTVLNHTLSTFQINRAAPSISALSGVTLTTNPSTMVVSPANSFLYVDDLNSPTSTLSILSLIAGGSPTAAFTHTEPTLECAMAITPNGQFLYLGQATTSSTMTGFNVAGNGDVTPLAQGPVSTGNFPTWASIDPQGQFMAVSNAATNSVTMYSIAANGNLTQVGSPVQSALVPGFSTFDPSGTHLYVSTGSESTTMVYSVTR